MLYFSIIVNGVIYDTAHEAAVARGLIYCPLANATKRVVNVDIHDDWPSPIYLRKAFVEMLLHGCITYPRDVWDSFGCQLFDNNNRDGALRHVENLLSEYGFSLQDFNLPGYSVTSKN